MGLTINSLEYFDQKAEKIKLNMEVHMDWYDQFLKWDLTKMKPLLYQTIKFGCLIWNFIIQQQTQRNMNQYSVLPHSDGHIF